MSVGLAVAAPWRGRGVGTALLRTCVAWAAGHGVREVSLEVLAHNEAALALYRRLGFEETSRRGDVIAMSLRPSAAD